MRTSGSVASLGAVVIAFAWGALLAVVVLIAVVMCGWVTGIAGLTRMYPSGPLMTPWTAMLLGGLAAAVALQHSPGGGVVPGRVLAGVVGATAVAFVAEYALGLSFGFDLLWFPDEVRELQTSLPGRPSPHTAISVGLLASAVALMRVDKPWTPLVRWLSLAGAVVIPLVSTTAYLFDALSLVRMTPSTGQALPTAMALLLIAVAACVLPNRMPVRWLLARPDRLSLVRLMIALAGFPIVVAMARAALRGFGMSGDGAWSVGVAVGTCTVGAVIFYLSQREHRLLIDKDTLSVARMQAEANYRILADNAVDVIVHLRGSTIAWVSPSIRVMLGGIPEQWVGSDFRASLHRDDAESVAVVLQRIADGESVLHRFRVRSGDGGYHWVDAHGKLYVDDEGRTDGLIAALRVVDDQVEASMRLERLARFDTLTGLVNRAEALSRLEEALQSSEVDGGHFGILFCDIDHFKQINDTLGHATGDAVLTELAERITQCVGPSDTVGRTGGDEILVLLPGIGSVERANRVAERIRRHAAQPLHAGGDVLRMSLSIGVATAQVGDDVTSITARADAAMYRAKAELAQRSVAAGPPAS